MRKLRWEGGKAREESPRHRRDTGHGTRLLSLPEKLRTRPLGDKSEQRGC